VRQAESSAAEHGTEDAEAGGENTGAPNGAAV
jgi:hypothetical protein